MKKSGVFGDLRRCSGSNLAKHTYTTAPYYINPPITYPIHNYPPLPTPRYILPKVYIPQIIYSYR